MGKELLEKINILLSHGWKKEYDRWVDPFTWKAHCFKEAYEIHSRYKRTNATTNRR